jgi:3-(3-hydroxy-phenyl)propionate hydroxylase
MHEQRDVVIVGAGPVGLTLALALARRGIDVLVLDRDASTAEHSRAPAIWPPTQAILHDLDVLDRFMTEGITLPELRLVDAASGDVLLTLPIEELSDLTDHPRLLIVPQSRTEHLLCEAAREAGAEIRFSTEVLNIRQEDNGVSVDCVPAPAVRARFVAGCDGASSRIREAIGASFDGHTYDTRAALADVRVAGLGTLPFPRLTTDPTLAVAIRIGTDLWRLILPIAAGDDRALPDRVAHASAVLLDVDDPDVVWQSEFRLHRRVSSDMAHGRVALAGDAAHLNSPVGGQGMNAGIGDAAALDRALAEALDRKSTEPLARYADERSHIVKTGVNPFTDRLTRVLLFRGGALVHPLLAAMRGILAVPPLRRRLLRRIVMLDPG